MPFPKKVSRKEIRVLSEKLFKLKMFLVINKKVSRRIAPWLDHFQDQQKVLVKFNSELSEFLGGLSEQFFTLLMTPGIKPEAIYEFLTKDLTKSCRHNFTRWLTQEINRLEEINKHWEGFMAKLQQTVAMKLYQVKDLITKRDTSKGIAIWLRANPDFKVDLNQFNANFENFFRNSPELFRAFLDLLGSQDLNYDDVNKFLDENLTEAMRHYFVLWLSEEEMDRLVKIHQDFMGFMILRKLSQELFNMRDLIREDRRTTRWFVINPEKRQAFKDFRATIKDTLGEKLAKAFFDSLTSAQDVHDFLRKKIHKDDQATVAKMITPGIKELKKINEEWKYYSKYTSVFLPTNTQLLKESELKKFKESEQESKARKGRKFDTNDILVNIYSDLSNIKKINNKEVSDANDKLKTLIVDISVNELKCDNALTLSSLNMFIEKYRQLPAFNKRIEQNLVEDSKQLSMKLS